MRHNGLCCGPFNIHVSIHAPAWGATISNISSLSLLFGFNPRTRMGCDSVKLTKFISFSCFNPRTRMGCDPIHRSPRTWYNVSIHAPAWGATLMRPATTISILFQSTHPHGVRRPSPMMIQSTVPFQSTHPHGVRLRYILLHIFQDAVSIHAPAWGATNISTCFRCDSIVSIHAPAWGATDTRGQWREI